MTKVWFRYENSTSVTPVKFNPGRSVETVREEAFSFHWGSEADWMEV